MDKILIKSPFAQPDPVTDGTGYQFNYSTGGLMTGKTSPNGGNFVYNYDALGRVTSAQDAVGGITRFASSNGAHQSVSSTIDQEGRTFSSIRVSKEDKAVQLYKTDRAGLVSTWARSYSGQAETRLKADGTSSTMTFSIDPEYKTKIPKEYSVRLPSGLTSCIGIQGWINGLLIDILSISPACPPYCLGQ